MQSYTTQHPDAFDVEFCEVISPTLPTIAYHDLQIALILPIVSTLYIRWIFVVVAILRLTLNSVAYVRIQKCSVLVLAPRWTWLNVKLKWDNPYDDRWHQNSFCIHHYNRSKTLTYPQSRWLSTCPYFSLFWWTVHVKSAFKRDFWAASQISSETLCKFAKRVTTRFTIR